MSISKEEVLERLREIVGPEYVTDKKTVLTAYSLPPLPYIIEKGVTMHLPDFVALPGSVAEIQEILRLANQYKIPVTPAGTLTSVYAESMAFKGGILMPMPRLNYYELDENNMTVTVGPGITTGQLYRELYPRGYGCNLWFGLRGLSNVSCMGFSTQRGFRAGKPGYIMEETIGLEVVLPTGEILTTGSAALETQSKQFMKYGYGPDLGYIFLGSKGALGIVTKQTMPIYPLPEVPYMHVQAEFDNSRDVVKPLIEIWSITGTNYGTLNGSCYVRWEPPTFEPPVYLDARVDGPTKEKAQYQKEAVERLFQKAGGRICKWEVEFEDEYGPIPASKVVPNIWEWGYLKAGCPGPSCPNEPKVGARGHLGFACPLYQIIEYLEIMEEIYRKHDLGLENILYKACGTKFPQYGIGGISFKFDPRDVEAVENARTAMEEVHRVTFERGIAPYRWGPTEEKMYMPMMGGYYELLKKIKQILDPNGILNPGKLLP